MIDDMPRPRPPYLQKHLRADGSTVWYVRRGKGPRIRIHGAYGSPEFTAEYHAAVAGHEAPKKGVAPSGTLSWLVKRYHDSGAWASLSLATRRKYELILKQVTDKSGDKPYVAINRKHIVEGRERRKATPFQANNFLKAMRGLFKWAVDADLVKADPTQGVSSLRVKTEGFHAWTEYEVEKYEAKWKIGTRERLAFDILIYTGLRRGDAVRLGRQHIRNGVFSIKSEKTGEWIIAPVLASLQASIDAGPTGELTFIVGEHGRPMTKAGFGNWFSKVCDDTGVLGSAHGLRKAGATRAANNGATVAQLEAIFGWKGGGMASLYTRKANREKLAREAMSKLESEQEVNRYAPQGEPDAHKAEK